MYSNLLTLLGRPVVGCWVRYASSYGLGMLYMVSELYPAGSAKALPGFRKFDCGLDEDVEHIKGGVCNIPHLLDKRVFGPLQVQATN